MSQEANKPAVVVDSRGFVSADGVCVGKLTSDGGSIVVIDKDKRRSQARGTRFVVIPLAELAKLAKPK